MWVKLKTSLVVVLLSGLIWVFAERAVTKSTIVTGVKIGWSTARKDLLIQWLDDQEQDIPTMQVNLEVEGPSGRIQDVIEGKLVPRLLLLDVEKLNYNESDDSATQVLTVDVVQILDEKLTFTDNDVFLPVITAQPPQLKVSVTKLTLATLNVEVLDKITNRPLLVEILDSKTVETYVKAGTTPEAKVLLNGNQQTLASASLIEATVEVLPYGRPQEFTELVNLAAGVSSWPEGEIARTHVRVGYLMPSSMQGLWKVNFDEEALLDDYSPIKFQWHSTAARDEFTNPEYIHLMLEVKESDLKETNPSRRLRYHLPLGREEEIEIIDRKQDAVSFSLEEIIKQPESPAEAGKIIKRAG